MANPSPQSTIQVAVRSAGSTNWTVTDLAHGPLGGVSITSLIPVAIDRAGNVTAAWMIWNGSNNIIQTATRSAGGVWSAPVTLSPTQGGSAFSPSLTVNARGDAGIAFVVSPYTGAYMPSYAQYVFRSGPAGSWSAPLTVLSWALMGTASPP